MITSSLSPMVVAAAPTQVATVGGGFLKRSEPLFLGGQAGPNQGFASEKDAMRAAAALSQNTGGDIFAVTASRGGSGDYEIHAMLQPVWQKGWGRENAYELVPATLEPLAGEGAERPKFGFVTKTIDKYGGRFEDTHSGRIKFDGSNPAISGLYALVGNGWGYSTSSEQLFDVRPSQPPVPPPVDPPVPPPVDPPRPPGPPGNRTLVEDVTEAVRLAAEAARIIGTVPPGDKGDESTKETRIKAFKTNMAAQSRLEKQFGVSGQPENVTSTLRRADANLEDANWQLAKKPSPDGRFNGVDVPGALRDTQAAVDLLNGLLTDLTKDVAA